MEKFDWKKQIRDWINLSKGLNLFESDLILFFEMVFNHVKIPEKSYFGNNGNSISLTVGRIFLASYVSSGKDKGIWLLVEKELHSILGVHYQLVKSTKKSNKQLYWLWIQEIENLKQILSDEILWNSFQNSSLLVETLSTHAKTAVEEHIKNKRLLDSFWYREEEYIPLAEEVVNSEVSLFKEGALKQVLVNAYERNSKARKECIEYYGNFTCQICGFDFEKQYGELGKNFIHVHHIKPLYQIKSDYVVNPITDLIPVCPNCHSMLHRKIDNKEVSVEELKKRLRNE